MPEVERSERAEDWKPVIERILLQVAYRNLGMVSLYCPIDVAAEAIDMLCEEGKGKWRWLLENRALVWENVWIDHALKIHMYVFGGKARRRNSIFVRQGFFKMYAIESVLTSLNRSILGRVLAAV